MGEPVTASSPEMATLMAVPSIHEMPYDDGAPIESPRHVGLLKAGYVAACNGKLTDYYVGVNMFVYY